MARLVHATIGSVELPGTNWLRELAEPLAAVDGVSTFALPPSGSDYVPGSGPQPQYMGPIGRWPDHTPPYNTPATIQISSLSQLNSALGSASSGDVIEVTGNPGTATITGGSTGWTQNVLVRPPLGQRGAVISGGSRFLFDGAARVTLAGFHTTIELRTDNGRRTCYAWMTMSPERAIRHSGGDSCWVYEVVRRGRTGSSGSSQIVHFRDRSGGMQLDDFRIIGCWFDGGYNIKDNIQQLAGVDSYLLESTVFRTGVNKNFESNGTSQQGRIANCWFDSSGTAWIENGGDYDWETFWDEDVADSRWFTNMSVCVNVRAQSMLVEDSIVLGQLRIQDGDGVFRRTVATSISDTPQGGTSGSTTLIQEDMDVDGDYGHPTHPVPFGFAGPSDAYLDSIWST